MKTRKFTTAVRTDHRAKSLIFGFGTVLILLASCPLGAQAQNAKPIVYPSGGQSLSQQSKDEGECQSWARQQTGFDPANTPQYAHGASGVGRPTDASSRRFNPHFSNFLCPAPAQNGDRPGRCGGYTGSF